MEKREIFIKIRNAIIPNITITANISTNVKPFLLFTHTTPYHNHYNIIENKKIENVEDIIFLLIDSINKYLFD